MDLGIAGKVAVVTGSAGGLGFAVAQKLAEEGTIPVLLDLKEKMLQEAVQKIRLHCPQAEGYVVDLTTFDAVSATYEEILKHFSPPEILVNCAGGGPGFQKNITELSEPEWKRLIDINLNSMFNTCKIMTKGMLKSCWGRIINFSSVAALRGGGLLGKAAYASSKAGVIGLTKALAREFGEYNITVNAIAPSLHITPLTSILTPEQREAIVSAFPLKRAGDPAGLGALVCFLASDYAAFITGATITVDGGYAMH
ncbi:SDR family NAD(P)-dependent oxidoreductase [Gelria sp. Kuro-4]|uniref:SDR family NAD(P)-dependent oxidoreductase n=1 Tax=Gelria sp. Kuro-4 TaxID=2796927 RepID=UPI001BF1225A|nr:SDR family NAD(P)-dependent oxidoreductase [Gelria sp. Kuro-4]BCV23515.1 3-oxoacyl-[acyl-carrier-protein] reductase FabG [Gelria sp. Kuro-4]